MTINIENLQKTSPIWYRHAGSEGDVILGVMGRLVRNLRGHAFPGWSTAEGRRTVAEQLLQAIQKCPGFKSTLHAEMSELDYGMRRALLERRQISPCMAARRDGCHLIINKRQDTVVMINEEEHLVIHNFYEKPDFTGVIERLYRLPDMLSDDFGIEFATHPRHGYLTSLPGEAGEGIQLYATLHLPALTLSNIMPQVTRAVDKLQLNLAPLYPQFGEECGNTYVLYTAPIIHGALEEMSNHLTNVMMRLAEREKQVRERLLALHNQGDCFLADRINRCYGMLRYACAIPMPEWLEAISMLRLGIHCGFIEPKEGTTEQLLADLAEQPVLGGEFATGMPIPERTHPRQATPPEKARSQSIQRILSNINLLTAPVAAQH